MPLILTVLGLLFVVPLLGAAGVSRQPRLLTAAGRVLAVLAGLLAFTQPRWPAAVLVIAALLLWFAPQMRLAAGGGRGLGAWRTGRRRRRRRIDPALVSGFWSKLLREALTAQAQFMAAIRRTPRGAIRERLADLSGEVEAALDHAWERARRGSALERAAGDIELARRASARNSTRWGRGWRPILTDERVLAAQRDRDAAARRLAASIAEERAQLQVLVARLVEAACSAAELSIAAGPAVLGPSSGDDVARELVERLATLRAALEEAANSSAAA